MAGQNRKLQNAIKSEFIAANTILSSDMADDSIVTDAINDDAITNAKTDVHHLKTVKFNYDFATHGGEFIPPFIPIRAATTESASIPANAVIVGVYMEVVTAPTSGGSATIKFGTQTNDDAFLAATAYNNAKFTANKITSLTGDLPLKMTAAEPVIINIGTANLTAGNINLFIEYYEGGTAGF